MQVPEISGIEFGEPWRLHDKAESVVIPILTSYGVTREYVLFEEDPDVTLTDTGKIDTLQIINEDKQYVFFRVGTLLKGPTQNRTLLASVVVAPGTKTFAPVRCIHSTSPIRAGASFTRAKGYAPLEVTETLTSYSDSDGSSQSDTWNATASYGLMAMSVSADSIGSSSIRSARIAQNDLVGQVERISEDIDKTLKSLPPNHVRQIGIVIVSPKRVEGLELFDNPASWAALSKSVIRNYADVLKNAAPDIYEVDMELVGDMIMEFLDKVQEAKGVSVFKENNAETFQLDDKELQGEFTLLYDGLIHLLASPSKGFKKSKRPRIVVPPIVIPPWSPRPRPWYPPRPYRPWKRTTRSSRPFGDAMNSYEIIQFLTTKRGYETLSSLQEGGAMTFTEIQDDTDMSSSTVDRALKDAKNLGLVKRVYRQANGRRAYELTELGKKTNPKKFRATYE